MGADFNKIQQQKAMKNASSGRPTESNHLLMLMHFALISRYVSVSKNQLDASGYGMKINCCKLVQAHLMPPKFCAKFA